MTSLPIAHPVPVEVATAMPIAVTIVWILSRYLDKQATGGGLVIYPFDMPFIGEKSREDGGDDE